MTDYTLADFKTAINQIGGKVKTKRHSDFIACDVTNLNGTKVNGALIFTSSDDAAKFRTDNEQILAVIKQFKGSTFDGLFRVVI